MGWMNLVTGVPEPGPMGIEPPSGEFELEDPDPEALIAGVVDELENRIAFVRELPILSTSRPRRRSRRSSSRKRSRLSA